MDGIGLMKAVATVVSGYSGDPDSRGAKTIKVEQVELDHLPVGTELYAKSQPSAMRLVIYAHSRDCNTIEVITPNKRYDLTSPSQSHGYVPCDLGIGGGDDIELVIDVMTGHILGWNPQKILDRIAGMVTEPED